jgi:hypothetical protein
MSATSVPTERRVVIDHRGRNFFRHFVEMVIAMLVGMAVLGAAVSGIFALLGHANLLHYAGVRGLLMTCYMTIGMALWMRHRRHGWAVIGEMTGAMFAPFVILVVPYESGALSTSAFLGLMHLLMLPAMAIAMLIRRDEYCRDHRMHSDHASGFVARIRKGRGGA